MDKGCFLSAQIETIRYVWNIISTSNDVGTAVLKGEQGSLSCEWFLVQAEHLEGMYLVPRMKKFVIFLVRNRLLKICSTRSSIEPYKTIALAALKICFIFSVPSSCMIGDSFGNIVLGVSLSYLFSIFPCRASLTSVERGSMLSATQRKKSTMLRV